MGKYDVLIGINLPARKGSTSPRSRSLRSLMRQGRLPAIDALAYPDHGPRGAACERRGHPLRGEDNGFHEKRHHETNRRRTVQKAYNRMHNITPQSIKKNIQARCARCMSRITSPCRSRPRMRVNMCRREHPAYIARLRSRCASRPRSWISRLRPNCGTRSGRSGRRNWRWG